MSAIFAIGTMNTADDRRKIVFTYARACVPSANSEPMLTRLRFIMVPVRGVIAEAVHDATSSVLFCDFDISSMDTVDCSAFI